MEDVIGRKYNLGRKIGSGSYGEVYRGRDLQTGERVAIKMENVDARHPWQGVSYDENPENICQKKITTSIESLCNSHPREFASYFRYCLSLRFQQMPDYAYLKSLFHDLFVRKGFQYDNMFD